MLVNALDEELHALDEEDDGGWIHRGDREGLCGSFN
jgi:hypothetical protein